MNDTARSVYQATLQMLRPENLIERAFPTLRESVSAAQRLLVCGAGKASTGLAAAFVHRCHVAPDGGLLVTKYGHGVPVPGVRVIEAGHPFPNADSLTAGQRMVEFARTCTCEDTVFFFLSGGASALMELPRSPWDLALIERVTRILVSSSVPIEQINAVRSRVSEVKGGGLSRAFGDAKVVVLVLDDVNGKGLPFIGSGPFLAPDPSLDPVEILRSRGIPQELPGDSDLPIPERTHIVLGDNRLALELAASAAKELGLAVRIEPPPLSGDVELETKRFIAAGRDWLDSTRGPACYLGGGEPLVTVRGEGLGGRCQEFAARASMLIQGLPYTVLAGSTDGTDGPTDVGAAVVDGLSVQRAGLDPAECLAVSDSLRFIEACGGAIRTGPTQCNVNDIYMMFAGT